MSVIVTRPNSKRQNTQNSNFLSRISTNATTFDSKLIELRYAWFLHSFFKKKHLDFRQKTKMTN